MHDKLHTPDPDWGSATFEGARREQMRRWSQLPLERILMAIEEMNEIANNRDEWIRRDGHEEGPRKRQRQ